MKKIRLNLKDIPQVNTPIRRHLINFTKEKFYSDEIQSGIPFFSEEELAALENKYRENGMTKKDVLAEIYKKGWQIKENTIKSYIQKGLIPRALKRVKTNQGMISIYPADTIRHMNFTRYCLFSEDESIRLLLSLIETASMDDRTLLVDASMNMEGYQTGDDCLHALKIPFAIFDNDVIPWVEESIGEAFENQEEKRIEYFKKFEEIKGLVDQLKDKIIEFEGLLESNTTISDMIPLDSLSGLLWFIKEKKAGK